MTVEEIKGILKGRKVGIAGAGGLGSNCAVALARAGIGTLVVADFDIVDETNLNRQYYFKDQTGMPKVKALAENISRIDRTVQVIAHALRLTRENIPLLFGDCDLVVEALDSADQKEILIETLLAAFPGKPLVIGLGVAGWGNSDTIHCRRSDNLYICGDEVSEVTSDLPPLAPRVGIVANMQANAVLEILLNVQTDSLTGVSNAHVNPE